jgi:hypothetical protein
MISFFSVLSFLLPFLLTFVSTFFRARHMEKVWIEYGYTLPTPCQVLGYTLPSPWVELAERKRNLEQSQAGKLSTETSRKNVPRVRRG